ncbi:hypothetical protein Bca4012_045493 [Brassica carinata]
MSKIKNLTLTLRILWRLVLGITGAHIIEDDARSEHHAVMKYSIADTATTKLRILFKLNSSLDMIFLDMMFLRSYARFVGQNKTSSKTAPPVVYDVATPKFWMTSTGVWKAHCITIARFYLFDSTKDITVLRCGHAVHLECTKDMELHNRYTCPLCSKSICDMSSVWKKLDEEVAAYKIPKVYEHKMVWILCNDCGSNTDVRFHLIAHKCSSCGSYNTRKTQRGPNTHSYSSGVPQVVSSTG